jgi:flagellar assembly protein FliH
MSCSAAKSALEGAAAPFCYAEAKPSGRADSRVGPQTTAEDASRRDEKAFERGREAAQQELQASIEAASALSRANLLQVLEQFAEERASYYHRIEGEVVQLALAIARKILHREVQIDPNVLAGIVRVTLDKLETRTRVDLYVHPREATDWRHFFACQMQDTPVPEIHEDGTLAEGECRIETSLGSSEIGLTAQLKEIETGLMDLLAETPATKQPEAALQASASTSPEFRG